ncbi:DUF4017 family protein [Solibacillus sp. FSL R7-0668]|uniref:DUF4017 family protein n=1 Tax=Solibacillus sp. FSL R7-0668 TaxID=2921688 RepID=UPI0030F76A5E
MKKILLPLAAYLVVCLIAILLPASDGYNTIGWKLLVGQIYAIPALIIGILITFFMNKKLSTK